MDEFLQYMNVDVVVDDDAFDTSSHDEQGLDPPVLEVSFAVAMVDDSWTWDRPTDYSPCEYYKTPDDCGYPKLKMEPLTRQERRAMTKLLLSIQDFPDAKPTTMSDSVITESSKPAAAKNGKSKANKTTTTTEASTSGKSDLKALRMVEIYKDPFTGRNKTKVHHIVDATSTSTINNNNNGGGGVSKRAPLRVMQRMHLNTISNLLSRKRSSRKQEQERVADV